MTWPIRKNIVLSTSEKRVFVSRIPGPKLRANNLSIRAKGIDGEEGGHRDEGNTEE